MKRMVIALVSVAVFAAGGVAQAQAGGVHEHDGLFLQLDLGGGVLSTKASQGGLDLELSGGGAEFSVAVGVAVTSNFIVAGQFWGVAVNSPTVKLNGQDLGSSDATLGLSGVGLNLTYYIMPANVYVSVTPSVGILSAKEGGQTAETDDGFALRLAVGKEFWVSDNWGIGLNLQYAHSSNKDKGVDPPTYGTNWFGAALSATFN